MATTLLCTSTRALKNSNKAELHCTLLNIEYGTLLADGIISNNHYNATYRYDKRGNIEELTRRGQFVVNDGEIQYTEIDRLTYDYGGNISNRLLQVADSPNASSLPPDILIDQPITEGTTVESSGTIRARSTVRASSPVTFRAERTITLEPGFSTVGHASRFLAETGPSTAAGPYDAGFVERSPAPYTYDANGNQTSNLDNRIAHIAYNYLNLPERIELTNGRVHHFSSRRRASSCATA